MGCTGTDFTIYYLYNFYTIFPSVPRSSKWFYFRSSHQTLVCAVPSCMPHVLPISSPQFVHPNNIWHAVHTIKLPICSSLHSVTSSLSGPNIFLSTLAFNTFILCSSRDVNDQVSHPYKISVLCTLICILDSK